NSASATAILVFMSLVSLLDRETRAPRRPWRKKRKFGLRSRPHEARRALLRLLLPLRLPREHADRGPRRADGGRAHLAADAARRGVPGDRRGRRAGAVTRQGAAEPPRHDALGRLV